MTEMQSRITQLERAARDLGFAVTVDGHVDERAAAALLNRSPGTLRNWRSQHRPLMFRRLGGSRGRVTYPLTELARFLIEAESTELHESARDCISMPAEPEQDATSFLKKAIA
jgi:hypothetical protein